MLSKDSLYVIFFSLPLYQLIFFTVQAVSFRWSSGRSRFMLGMMMLTITLVLFSNLLFYFNYLDTFKWAYFVHIPLLLVILPVYYIYIQTLAAGLKSVNPRRLLVLLFPALLVFILNVITWGSVPELQQMEFLRNGLTWGDGDLQQGRRIMQVFWLGNVALLGGQLVIVIIRSIGIIFQAKRASDDDPSVLPYLNVPWLIMITLGTILLTVTLSAMNILTPFDNQALVLSYNVLIMILSGMTGYFGLRQDHLIREVSKIHEHIATPSVLPFEGTDIQTKDETEEPPDRQQLLLSHGETINRLKQLMQQEKPFLDPDLTIGGLAEMMEMSKRELSYLINTVLDQNFYGIVNEYRMEETLEILQEKRYEYLTIEAIAEKVGFRSKSSFNACFKKYTGLTPRQYKEKIKDIP